ncbi:flagellar hook-length control protein FliK [Lachnospiraceae bacterium 46-15]
MTGTERVQSFNRMQGAGSTDKAGSKESASAGVEGIFERLLQERQNAMDETENKKDTVQSDGKQDTKETAQTEKTEPQQTGDKKAEGASESKEANAEEVLAAQMLGAAYLLNETEFLEVPEESAAVQDGGIAGVEGVFVSQAEEKLTEDMPVQSAEENVQTVFMQEQTDMSVVKAETASAKAEANSVKELGNRSQEEGMFQAETAVQASGNDIRQSAQVETAAVKDISVPVKTTESTLASDVAKTLAARMPADNGTLTLELEPASLGKLTIRMTYEAGKAVVSIMATNTRTLELLSQRSGEIAAILEERTGQETVVQPYQPSEEAAYYGQGQENGRERQQQQEQGKENKETDSFMQQLRLGLI